jgi:hypothetical protein
MTYEEALQQKLRLEKAIVCQVRILPRGVDCADYILEISLTRSLRGELWSVEQVERFLYEWYGLI